MLLKLLVATVLMFGFGYALVPLYRAICEITGINVLTTKNTSKASAVSTQVDVSRTVTVVFDANSRGALTFVPDRNHMEVNPGELAQVVYRVTNNRDVAIQAQAIPSYVPKTATEHFSKLECFCFQQQTLGPRQTVDMPVVFQIGAALPRDVNSITLSYTFFEIGAVK